MRSVVAALEESRIREVANAGLGRPDVLRFWFGESDEVTPEVVRAAAIASLQAGETFYAHNLGLPELREAIAAYMAHTHPAQSRQAADWFGRIAVTSGGVNGLMLAAQALVDAGDEVVVVEPAWPNLVAQPRILGARVRTVSLAPDAYGHWRLDLSALLGAITPATRLLVVNSPNNPTGWTLDAREQAAILAHCRGTGTWIVADEVYERLYYPDGEGAGDAACAPSFLDLAQPEDRLIVAHSFSKSFLMTGWRLGWLVLPPSLTHALGKLVEYNTSCAPVFVQRGALAALQQAHERVPPLVARFRQGRDTLLAALTALPGVQAPPPPGGMYVVFRLSGRGDDDLALAKQLVREAGLGLAPGSAFGDAGRGWLRWCFASRDPARLQQGVDRLREWLRL
ncbi:Aspartate aminotransferase [Tepidimonas fonticaldi]|uniref:Aminotransferase n=1 Tax=Tepidimonas fonticaldi TaxID=1101373 RepID=A0A554XQD9_9BURK|nr:pyridoxal phosphate-dependent aminotransferase [Tepidimonas fonticaldi]TSE38037.1 Aspartate aminotransferase [Tepidimonas fonticaldi]